MGSTPIFPTKFIPHLQEGNRESQYAFCVKILSEFKSRGGSLHNKTKNIKGVVNPL